jgi:hypothetical protein
LHAVSCLGEHSSWKVSAHSSPSVLYSSRVSRSKLKCSVVICFIKLLLGLRLPLVRYASSYASVGRNRWPCLSKSWNIVCRLCFSRSTYVRKLPWRTLAVEIISAFISHSVLYSSRVSRSKAKCSVAICFTKFRSKVCDYSCLISSSYASVGRNKWPCLSRSWDIVCRLCFLRSTYDARLCMKS